MHVLIYHTPTETLTVDSVVQPREAAQEFAKPRGDIAAIEAATGHRPIGETISMTWDRREARLIFTYETQEG